jgi:hypothetical protein
VKKQQSTISKKGDIIMKKDYFEIIDDQKDLNFLTGLLGSLLIAAFVAIYFFPSTANKGLSFLIFASTMVILLALNRIGHILLDILHKLDKD